MNLNPLAFQYMLRGGRLADLDGQMLAAAHEQRDRELEDYLGQLAVALQGALDRIYLLEHPGGP